MIARIRPPASLSWRTKKSSGPDRLSTRRALWIGVAAAAVVATLLIGSSLLSRTGFGQQTIHVEFAQAAGLRPGATVDVSGIAVGEVRSVRVEGDRVVADLEVREDLRLGKDATAAIEMSTILGRLHVDLTPGRGEPLAGDRIPLAHTKVPYSLSKVVNDPRYNSQFERLERIDPAKIRAALEAVNTQMGDSPQLTVEAIDSVGVLARVISDRRDDVETLLHGIDEVSQLVSDNRNGVLVLLTRGEAVTSSLVQRRELLTQLLDNVAALSQMLRDMGVENQGQFGTLIRDLDTMSAGLEKNRDNLAQLYETMPPAIRQINNVFGNGPYGDVWAPWLFPDNWLCFTQVIEGCR